MSPPDLNQNGEDFGSSPSSSSTEYWGQSDTGAKLWPMAKSWTSEQLNILLHWVEDWKASKNIKSQQLILQGVLTDLCRLPIAPPMDGQKLVSRKHWFCHSTVTNVNLSI